MKRHEIRPIALLALATFLAVPALAQKIPSETAEATVREIQQSHIDANVPGDGDFDRLLRRALVAYFSSGERPPPEVSYELLREGPTQTGMAYPKFYVWVQVQEEDQPARAGAVRLAAIERQRFQVLQFVDKPEIKRDPSGLAQLFPPPVAAAIKARVDAAP